MKTYTLIIVVIALLPTVSQAQESSLWQRETLPTPEPSLTLPQASLIYQQPIQPRQIKIHDLVTIRVDQKSRFESEGEVNKRKTAAYELLIGDDEINGDLTSLYRADGELESTELLTLDVTARIVDIRPNGNLVLEAHQQVRNNNEVWDFSLSGICRTQDILDGNVVLSKNIYDLRIYKRERGSVRDSYKRGWFVRWLDQFHPF
jgi:flagellar L-ring protein precursor FlgH